MKKIFLLTASAIVFLGICAGIWWMTRPQVITLKDGTKLTLLGVTYGRHHVPPRIEVASARRHGATIDSESNAVVVWIESEGKKKGPNQWPNYQLFIYDRAETACVSAWSRSGSSQIKNGIYVQGFTLDAFPRWDREILVRVGAWDNRGGGMQPAKGQFVISNPERAHSFTKWTPEPIPDTQSDGDLNVTLTKLVYGVPGFGPARRTSSKDPMSEAVLAVFHCEQNGNAVTNWQAMQIETSDATGNHVQNTSWSTGRDTNGDATMTYQYGLWPGESPWKLRVEMSRTSGFHDDELWNVANVPVHPGTWQSLWNYRSQNRASESAFAETTLDGVHLKIFPVVQTTDQNYGNGEKPGGVRVETDSELPDGFRLSVLATDERGRALQTWGPNGGNKNYVLQIQNLRDAKSLNLAIALHKSRFVEFTVQPQKQ